MLRAVGRVKETVDVPQAASQAEALWYDTSRWPTFVDGFGHLVRKHPDWPRAGELVWDSTPDGRGRVLERVQAYEARVRHVTRVEDDQLRGVQTVTFTPTDKGCTVGLELDYELKRDTPGTALFDFFFVRRPMKDALRRTMIRFKRELRDDVRPPL